jgi:predicted RNA-binding protein with PUA-like domain
MAYWLLKTEPSTWSFAQQEEAGAKGTAWDGVRNHQAKRHLQAMRAGDLAFFYHSGDDKAVVGIVAVTKPYYPDPADPKFGMVDVRVKEKLPRPVALAEIKRDPRLADMVLVRNSRLSVQPVTPEEWEAVLEMSRK